MRWTATLPVKEMPRYEPMSRIWILTAGVVTAEAYIICRSRPEHEFATDTSQYANNRAELSHQPTRVRERGMRKFKSAQQAQRFLNTHAAVYNLFNLGRHLITAEHYRSFRARSLPLGYNEPLRLGIVPQPYNQYFCAESCDSGSHLSVPFGRLFHARITVTKDAVTFHA